MGPNNNSRLETREYIGLLDGLLLDVDLFRVEAMLDYLEKLPPS